MQRALSPSRLRIVLVRTCEKLAIAPAMRMVPRIRIDWIVSRVRKRHIGSSKIMAVLLRDLCIGHAVDRTVVNLAFSQLSEERWLGALIAK
jgi:hypothetical protein